MKKYTSLLSCILIVLSHPILAQGTDWAGPDTSTCGQKGVIIGSAEPCNSCCYLWSPVEGLDDPYIKNPKASPDHPTTYTVTVVDQNLSWKKTDHVFVDLSFGEFVFQPDHLEQGTDDIALVRLKNNTENFPTAWSFSGEDLGCTIEANADPNLATVHAGDHYGKLMVKVQHVNDAECFYIDELPVNNGVKDLKVIDVNNPGRFATTGGTLYLVGLDQSEVVARLIAIPNEGGFANGIPDYKDDIYFSTTPQDGDDDQETNEIPLPVVGLVEGHTSVYQAGNEFDYDPKVTVIRVLPSDDAIDFNSLKKNFSNFTKLIFESLKFGDLIPPSGFCPVPSTFQVDTVLNVSFKQTEVEKYNDPGLGQKKKITLDVGLTVSGKVYHPEFTIHQVLFGVGICSEVYVGLSAGGLFHVGATTDPSLEDDSWMPVGQIEYFITGSAGFNAIMLTGTGINLQAAGSGSMSLKVITEYVPANKQIVAYAILTPLTIKIEAKVVSETNMGEFKPIFNLLSEEFVLYKGYKTDPTVLATFD